MAATGPATSVTLELNFSGATWTDLSSRVATSAPTVVRVGRSSRYADTDPSTFEVVLDNSDGYLTPDNPLSPYYPSVVEGIGVRFSVAKTGKVGSPWKRFAGRVVSIEPDVPEGDTYASTVRVTATCTLGQLARRNLRAEFVERWEDSSRAGADVDLWPLDDAGDVPSSLQNIGTTAFGVLSGTVVSHVDGTGSASWGTPDGIALDSTIDLSQTNGFGPVIKLPLSAFGSIGIQDLIVPFRTTDRIVAGKAMRYIAQGLTADGSEVWSLRLADNAGQTDLRLYDTAGAYGVLLSEFAPAGDTEAADDNWFVFRLYDDGANQNHQLWRLQAGLEELLFWSTSAGYTMTNTEHVILGGNCAGTLFSPGKQKNCTSTSYGAIAVAGTEVGHWGYLQVNSAEPVQTRMTDDLDRYTETTCSVVGTGNEDVVLVQTSGRTALDLAQECARTVGGIIRPDFSGLDLWQYVAPDQIRRPLQVATIDAVSDLDATAGFPWRRGVDKRPTRVQVSYPGGTVTVTGDESLTVAEDSVQTAAVGAQQARNVGSARVNTGVSLAIEQLTVDLASAENDLWTDVMSVVVGNRLRVSNLPSTYYGVTYKDVYVLGWTEEHDHYGSRLTFDTEPADDPTTGRFDRDTLFTAGGTMTVTSGTAVGTTSNGTLVITTSSGPTLTTAAGSYPLNLNWNGEVVTITSAPASSVSPQTVTTTSRGVAPSVARSHAANESIDVASGAHFTF